MPAHKVQKICLITRNLQQGNIIKTIIDDAFYKKNDFFIIGDIDSIRNVTNHIILLDYQSIETERISNIKTDGSNNNWIIINTPQNGLLSSSFWIESGFCGVLYERHTISDISKALTALVDKGEYWFTRKELSHAIKEHHHHDIPYEMIAEVIANQYRLTHKEKDVLFFMLEGQSNQQIANKIYISIHTVKNHVSHIMSKIGVSSRKELLAVNFN